MSVYTYTDQDGDSLEIRPGACADYVIVCAIADGRRAGAYIANADAPTVAAELLKAAGQEDVFVAKSAEEVQVHENGILECGSGPRYENATLRTDPKDLRHRAASCIALAKYIENKAQRETEAAAKLAERRNRIAVELAMGEYAADAQIPGAYASARASMQRAVDRIIELEDKAAQS